MILCTNCRRPYPETGAPYRCTVCGGTYDFDALPPFDPAQVERELPGLWRYRHTFGLPPEAPLVTLGEGNTPLVWGKAFGQQVAFKSEHLNPTGSFKDRGSAPLLSFLRARGVQAALEDSSGNAGASFAAYCARAGVAGRVFIPQSASGPKRAQIEAYGAQVVRVPGPRSNAAEAVRQAAGQVQDGASPAYASHVYLPFALPGYATVAYELVEQMGQAPGTLIVPAGQGNLLLAAGRGFQSMLAAGVIDRVPRLVGVQARACAPLWAVFNYGATGLGWVTEGETLAEGVRIKYPLRGDAVLQMVASSGGLFVAVDEAEILPGRDQLARQGLYVEPTSAIVWSALAQVMESVPGPVAVLLTGSGYKVGPV